MVYLVQTVSDHARPLSHGCQEINELRYVLVPKYQTDAQFWAIYFALTRSRLPPEGFDESLQMEEQPVHLEAAPRPALVPPPPERAHCCCVISLARHPQHESAHWS